MTCSTKLRPPLLLSLLSALIQPLDVVCKGNFPMDTHGKEIPTISVIARTRTRPNKLQRFVYLLFDDTFR